MKVVGLVALGVVAMAGVGFGYEPPELLAEIKTNWPCTDFTCAGDQNGDGCDDFLVGNGWWADGNGDREFTNTVELYYGGEEMDNTPDFSIQGPPCGPLQLGKSVNFLGRLTASDNPWWAIQIMTFDTSYDYPYTWTHEVWLYEAGTALDTIPEFKLCPSQGDMIYMGNGRNMRPTDVNGDGYDDLIVSFVNPDSLCQMRIYFGGEAFDTLPDWQITFPPIWDITSGYDVNGDGYDDLITQTEAHGYVYTLFLGGDPMDTTCVFALEYRHFEPKVMLPGITMLPDVNDDGYDDWAIHWCDYEHSGYYYLEGYFIFYGSPEPDAEPDLLLPGFRDAWSSEGFVTGGDFNGDGVGDIVTMSIGGWHGHGEMLIYLGSPWFDNQPEIDVHMADQYGSECGERIGGTGDYNGDGADDWAAGSHSNAVSPYFILGGNRGWRVGVQEEIAPEKFDLQLASWPNPFNNIVNLNYQIPASGRVSLAIYDLAGREISVLADQWLEADRRGSASWSSQSSGIFIANLQWTDSAGKTRFANRKIVCVK